MGCPDEQAILRYVAGELIRDELDRIDAHVDDCLDCAELVADAVRHAVAADLGAAPLSASRSTPLASGTHEPEHDTVPPTIGRYTVLSRLGRGGMGTVYAAYDPRLDRRAAIKVLRRDRNASDRQLRREGRALAALTHPNVVAVFEVGMLARDASPSSEVYLAMELVEGPTLREWVAAAPRTEAEIVAAYVQAGHGLSAAHALGIVHRDFKPDNVLVGTPVPGSREVGRVRVTDFGLARLVTADSRATHPGAVTLVHGECSTQAGMVAGTPAYMAPEQRAGAAIDGRADQYAFCVSLWEALCGTRPTEGDARHVAPRSGHLRRVLRRGLEPDPERRWPSMDVMLAALERRPGRRAPWIATAAAAIGAIAWLSGPPLATSSSVVSGSPIAAIATARNDAVRAELERARSVASVDRPEDGVDLTRRVLEHARDLGAGALLADALLEHGRALKDAGRYAEARATLSEAHLTASAHGADSIAAAAATQQMFVVGTIAEDLDAGFEWVRHAEAAIERMPAGERAEAQASLSSAHGNLLLTAGREEEALAQFQAALRFTEQAHGLHHPDLVLRLNDLGNALMERDRGAALQHFERALAIAIAEHGEHHATVGLIVGNLGALHQTHGDLEVAAVHAARALEINERARGAMHPQVGASAYNLGVVQDRLGEVVQARASFLRALEIWSATLGAGSKNVGLVHDNLGALALGTDDLHGAEAHYQRALLIYELALGDDDPQCITPLSGLAEVAMRRGQYPRALELARRALALGRDRPRAARAGSRLRIADALAKLGRESESLEMARASLADVQAGDDPTQTAEQTAEYVREIEGWIAQHGGAA